MAGNYITPTADQVTDWVIRNFPDHKLRRGGDILLINNPLSPDTGYHLGIVVTKATCNDFRGNSWAITPKGKTNRSFLKFVQLYRGCTFNEAVKEVCGTTVKLHRRKQEETPAPPSFALPVGSVRLVNSPYPKVAAVVRHWLYSRGFRDEHIAKYDIHHAGTDAVWPYYEFDDQEIVYWQSRSAVDKTFDFPLLTSGRDRNDYLFGFNHVEPASDLIIVEAIIDCMSLGDQCVATGGASLSSNQIKKIKILGPQDGIILAADNDAAGIDSIIKNWNLLRSRISYPLFYSLPPKTNGAKDWNDLLKAGMPFAEVRAALRDGTTELTEREIYRLSELAADG